MVLFSAKMNGFLRKASHKDQLADASQTTGTAYAAVQSKAAERGSEDSEASVADPAEKTVKEEDDKRMSPKVAMMQPILRFLQLLCENHNKELQVWLLLLLFLLPRECYTCVEHDSHACDACIIILPYI